ncbi:PIR protein [Plasmodium ovale]|uniref:PIR protein n=1 Tax=Plasmodium ovale TaxID=36330 RepID=A0A1C3KJ12_PLAOA|nr:PIR protein [Plasmodium ovale]
MDDILKKNNLDELPSNSLNYKNFNNASNAYCEYISVLSIKNDLNTYSTIKDVSDKLVNALCFLSIFEQNEACNKRCNYLYFWIGNEIIDKVENDAVFSEIIRALYKGLESNSRLDKCKCTYNSINKEHFKKMKTVFDYFYDHSFLTEELPQYNKRCDREYKEYLNYAVTTYDSVYKFCIEHRQESYCADIVKFIPTFLSEKKLTSLECDLQETISDMKSSVSLTADMDPNLRSIGGSSEIFISIFFPLLGIIFIYFLLHKFTPVGTWIHKRLGFMKRIRPNLSDMGTNELIEDYSEPEKVNFGKNIFNIAYRSL